MPSQNNKLKYILPENQSDPLITRPQFNSSQTQNENDNRVKNNKSQAQNSTLVYNQSDIIGDSRLGQPLDEQNIQQKEYSINRDTVAVQYGSGRPSLGFEIISSLNNSAQNKNHQTITQEAREFKLKSINKLAENEQAQLINTSINKYATWTDANNQQSFNPT